MRKLQGLTPRPQSLVRSISLHSFAYDRARSVTDVAELVGARTYHKTMQHMRRRGRHVLDVATRAHRALYEAQLHAGTARAGTRRA